MPKFLDKRPVLCYAVSERNEVMKEPKDEKKAAAAPRKGGRFNSITVYNRFFETVDVWIYNAGIQAKTRHSWEYTDRRDILQYVTDGEGTLECNGRAYHLSKHTLFLLPKGVHVKYYAAKENPYHYYWISFSGVYADILLSQSGLSASSPVRNVPDPVIKRSFKRIYDCLRRSQEESAVDCSLQPKILASFYDIFAVLLENKSAARPHSANELINRAIDVMNNEFSDGITVTDVCAKLFLNRTYFSVLFRKYMNVSPGEYLLNLRFNEACKLLKQTSLSVQAVAEGVGMAPNAFFKLFKSRMNMAPGAYRNERTAPGRILSPVKS